MAADSTVVTVEAFTVVAAVASTAVEEEDSTAEADSTVVAADMAAVDTGNFKSYAVDSAS